MKKKFKYIVLFLTLIIGMSNVSASTITKERTENNLGVNKKWTIDESNIDNVYATPRVDASEKIYDYANILSESEELLLYGTMEDYIEKTDMDIVILTTDLAYSESSLETYASDFYDYNDFGINFELYSGIIVIVNMNDYNRFYNIYTFGNAQLYYPYNRCESILDDMYSDMANSYYYYSLSKYIISSTNFYNSGIPSGYENSYIDDMGYIQTRYSIPWIIALIISSIITIITMSIMISKNKMVKKASTAKEYLDSASVNYTNRKDQFITSHTSSYTVSSSSGGGGGGSSSGSSGGGHGGGGGRSF